MTTRGPWQILSEHKVHESPWIRIDHYDVITPAGTNGTYTTVDFKNWAIGIIPIDDEGYTYIVGQYRFPLQDYSWEIPEGGGAKNTTLLASAQRELLEETGIRAKHWKMIYEFHTSNSVTNERAFIFLATDLEFGLAQPEETEQLSLRRIPFQELVTMVYNNEIKDSLTVIAVLVADNIMRQRTLSTLST
ncbi:NUDIX domain-containing protein [Methylocucumis oryzae]|uniref:GDP-mannose pyrophosphatase n=1 Tax=Methylocucumis oryzae TaxID=1632867 RepID=A0A0F3IGJ0_9GAMM|nr:NUDIX hydrolase [Methylocucumis oryzae]KJV05876.1 DNA mismatch repair protein MutT [Methylocucumis oryzae]